MIIYVDIDNTITKTIDTDYPHAEPIPERIARINSLYQRGYTIVYWTARGTKSNINWRELTESQLKKWGVKYHRLEFGKPVYDLFIDDKNCHSDAFFSQQDIL